MEVSVSDMRNVEKTLRRMVTSICDKTQYMKDRKRTKKIVKEVKFEKDVQEWKPEKKPEQKRLKIKKPLISLLRFGQEADGKKSGDERLEETTNDSIDEPIHIEKNDTPKDNVEGDDSKEENVGKRTPPIVADIITTTQPTDEDRATISTEDSTSYSERPDHWNVLARKREQQQEENWTLLV